MGDPLSAVASVGGLLTLGIQVTETLVRFYQDYKNLNTELSKTTTKLDGLLQTLRSLESTVESRKAWADGQDLVDRIYSSIAHCSEVIHELEDECLKLRTVGRRGLKAKVEATKRQAAYPFRKSTLQRLDEDIDELRDNLSLALDALNLQHQETIRADLVDIKRSLDTIQTNQASSDLQKWLKAPDVMMDHNSACDKRHPGTGSWLTKSTAFKSWLSQERSFLWLQGFAGCGKSVLCSTAIQHTFRHQRTQSECATAFFFFKFNDDTKRDESGMLRALILQLSNQLTDSDSALARLRDQNRTGLPPSFILVEYLRTMIQKFHHVYILLDALDECPRYGSRDKVLETITTMRRWEIDGLHLLVTSRDELDIREALELVTENEIILSNKGIENDINDFIAGNLKTDRQLRKLSLFHDQIKQVLSERAHGVFRWVECQFESLRNCPRSKFHIEERLKSLPRTLDDTYDQMLDRIDEDSVETAIRILTMLCFAARPLTVGELIEGVAVDLRDPARLDPDRRLQDADDLLQICPALIHISVSNDMERGYHHWRKKESVVRISHFSVQEYLQSTNRIRDSKAVRFALDSETGHFHM